MPVVWFESYVGDRIQIPGADEESLLRSQRSTNDLSQLRRTFRGSHFCNDSHALLAKRADSC